MGVVVFIFFVLFLFAGMNAINKKKKAKTAAFQRAENERKRRELLIAKYGEPLAKVLLEKKYFLGMTTSMVKDARGNPTDIETEVLKDKTRLMYIYGTKRTGDVFNFENDKLVRFKER